MVRGKSPDELGRILHQSRDSVIDAHQVFQVEQVRVIDHAQPAGPSGRIPTKRQTVAEGDGGRRGSDRIFQQSFAEFKDPPEALEEPAAIPIVIHAWPVFGSSAPRTVDWPGS